MIKLTINALCKSIVGNLTPRHKEVFLRNPLFVGMRLPEVRETVPLEKKFNRISSFALELMKVIKMQSMIIYGNLFYFNLLQTCSFEITWSESKFKKSIRTEIKLNFNNTFVVKYQ